MHIYTDTHDQSCPALLYVGQTPTQPRLPHISLTATYTHGGHHGKWQAWSSTWSDGSMVTHTWVTCIFAQTHTLSKSSKSYLLQL